MVAQAKSRHRNTEPDAIPSSRHCVEHLRVSLEIQLTETLENQTLNNRTSKGPVFVS